MWKYSLVVLGTGLLIAHALFVVNTSASFPPGLYLKTHEAPQKGDLVLFCPPDTPIFHEALQRKFLSAGLCPAGSGAMIKRIAAVQGDSVRISASSVSVNTIVLPDSQQHVVMEHALSVFTNTLQAKEVLLMSPHPQSFDGRYFGPLLEMQISTTLKPFFLWKE